MRPADETAAFRCSNPQDSKTLSVDCQTQCLPGPEPPDSRGESRELTPYPFSVLILDALSKHAASFVDALQAKGIAAIAFKSKQEAYEFVARRSVELAIYVLHSKSWWRDELRLFCNSIRHAQENVEIICILTWQEECPLDRLYGDTLNVTVLHE